jgi:hypothetical protein
MAPFLKRAASKGTGSKFLYPFSTRLPNRSAGVQWGGGAYEHGVVAVGSRYIYE